MMVGPKYTTCTYSSYQVFFLSCLLLFYNYSDIRKIGKEREQRVAEQIMIEWHVRKIDIIRNNRRKFRVGWYIYVFCVYGIFTNTTQTNIPFIPHHQSDKARLYVRFPCNLKRCKSTNKNNMSNTFVYIFNLLFWLVDPKKCVHTCNNAMHVVKYLMAFDLKLWK